MKLLLTSMGICNESIAKTLDGLTNLPRSEVKVGFISTAANVEIGDKGWFLKQLDDLRNFGFKWIDIVDISATEISWQEHLEPCNVIFVSGGNTFHLLNETRRSGFDKWLKENLGDKVYVGSSAGSILLTPSIGICNAEPPDINFAGITDLLGLGYVDFEFSPHSPEIVSYEENERYAKTINNKLYAVDDQTAIKVVDGATEIVSEGAWREYK